MPEEQIETIPTLISEEELVLTEIESLSSNEDIFEAFKENYFKQKEELNVKTQEIIDRLEKTKNEIMHSLTSVPMHPYDRLKHEYLEDGYMPIDLDSVEVPEDFSPDTTIQAITAITQQYDDITDCQIQMLSSCIENKQPMNDPNIGNVFTVLSGDAFVIDRPKMKSHLEFIEFLRNIPIYKIEQAPELVCKKILTQYLKSY